jgi:hypothetical protein
VIDHTPEKTESQKWQELKRAALVVRDDIDYEILGLWEDDRESYEQVQARMTKAFREMRGAIVALGLIRPFNWNNWGRPNPTREEVGALDDDDVSKFLTRIIRQDRFMEGTFDHACRIGIVSALALRAYHIVLLDEEGWPKALQIDDKGALLGDIECVAKAETLKGRVISPRYVCPLDCPGFRVQVKWDRRALPTHVCSSKWHYDWDTNQIIIVGGGMFDGLSKKQDEDMTQSSIELVERIMADDKERKKKS